MLNANIHFLHVKPGNQQYISPSRVLVVPLEVTHTKCTLGRVLLTLSSASAALKAAIFGSTTLATLWYLHMEAAQLHKPACQKRR